MGRKFIDKSGQKFGQILFMKPILDEKRLRWECLCLKCNKKFIRTANNLNRLNTNNSPCKHCYNTHYADLSNMQFGDILVIKEDLNRISKCGRKYWLCRCKCGNQLSIDTFYLTNPKFSIKNCKLCKINTPKYGDISRRYWYNIQKGAKARNLIFDINIKDIWELFLKQKRKCALSGINISCVDKTASLDRINSNIGYILGNVQWVHKMINYMKYILDQQEFIDWCELVVKNDLKNLTI